MAESPSNRTSPESSKESKAHVPVSFITLTGTFVGIICLFGSFTLIPLLTGASLDDYHGGRMFNRLVRLIIDHPQGFLAVIPGFMLFFGAVYASKWVHFRYYGGMSSRNKVALRAIVAAFFVAVILGAGVYLFGTPNGLEPTPPRVQTAPSSTRG